MWAGASLRENLSPGLMTGLWIYVQTPLELWKLWSSKCGYYNILKNEWDWWLSDSGDMQAVLGPCCLRKTNLTCLLAAWLYHHDHNYVVYNWLSPQPFAWYMLCRLLKTFANSFGSTSGPTKCRAWSGSKPFVTLIVFLKEFFEKVDFEKSQQTTTKTLKTTQHAKKLKH